MENLAPAPEQPIEIGSIDDAIEYLRVNHPDAIKLDDRDGYDGVIVAGERLVDIARVIRDDLGFRLSVQCHCR